MKNKLLQFGKEHSLIASIIVSIAGILYCYGWVGSLGVLFRADAAQRNQEPFGCNPIDRIFVIFFVLNIAFFACWIIRGIARSIKNYCEEKLE